jgi:hypothetical protein
MLIPVDLEGFDRVAQIVTPGRLGHCRRESTYLENESEVLQLLKERPGTRKWWEKHVAEVRYDSKPNAKSSFDRKNRLG